MLIFRGSQKIKYFYCIFCTRLWISGIWNINGIKLSIIKHLLQLLEFLESSAFRVNGCIIFVCCIVPRVCINRGLCSSLTEWKLLSELCAIARLWHLLNILSSEWSIGSSWSASRGSVLTQASNSFSLKESITRSLRGIDLQVINHALHVLHILRLVRNGSFQISNGFHLG